MKTGRPPVITKCICCGSAFLAHVCRLEKSKEGLCCSKKCKYILRRKRIIEKWNLQPCDHQPGASLTTVCTKCYKSAESRKRHVEDFNISEEEYGRIAEFQGDKCAICNLRPVYPYRKRLSIDHAHETGLIRGLLCWRCNVAIESLEDHMDRLAAYLKDPPAVKALGAPAGA